MRYECVNVNLEFLRKAIASRGMTERQFAILMWGEDTHRTINDFLRRPNTTIETAMKVCNILDISLDDFFGGSDKIGASPFIVGNQNIINSSVINQDPKSLQAENRALRLLIKEKDERINDLKRLRMNWEPDLIWLLNSDKTRTRNSINCQEDALKTAFVRG